ncbi:MAG: hypothetical protein K2H41_13950 [Acetatifactor sp.]|nr:hypothetical protein [Acetatifactor sp.]
MDRKKRIEELRRKNTITNLCKTWINNGINISIENFLGIEETLSLQNKILSKIDEMNCQNACNIYGRDEMNIVSVYIKELENNICSREDYVFFARESTEIGGIILQGNVIIEKKEFIVKESELSFTNCCIFLSSLNAEKGICLWRGEYDIRIYIW